jgi:hypothetical protein
MTRSGGTGSGDGISAITLSRGLYGSVEDDGTANLSCQWDFKELAFTYVSVSPLTLAVVVSGERVVYVGVLINTAFNDGAAVVTVGHTGDTSAFLSGIIPQEIALFEVWPMYQYGGADSVKIYIDPRSSTQGSGVAFIATERAS